MHNRACFSNPFAVNVLTSSKNSLNLLKSTFIQCFHHFEPNWVQVFLELFTPKDVLTLNPNSSSFWKLSGCERVNESQKLLKSAKKYYYPNFSSLWTKLSKKKLFLIRYEILGLLDKTLTANYKYLRIIKREFTVTNLNQIIYKTVNFLQHFFYIFRICKEFAMFWKKKWVS